MVGPASEVMIGLNNQKILWENQYFNLASTNTYVKDSEMFENICMTATLHYSVM